jgi:hypothetical protein
VFYLCFVVISSQGRLLLIVADRAVPTNEAVSTRYFNHGLPNA